MQTHEWEALLKGTTERPWVIGANLKDPLVDVSAATREDARLLAAAPAAVAEVIRLRKAIEAVRDDYQRNAEADRLLPKFSTVPLVPVFNDLADTLTRILEGEEQ